MVVMMVVMLCWGILVQHKTFPPPFPLCLVMLAVAEYTAWACTHYLVLPTALLLDASRPFAILDTF